METTNTSGLGKGHTLPAGVPGWSWGAFLLNWIWAICNNTWIGLLSLIPWVGFVMPFVLGVNGRTWAWQNKHWESVEHFNRTQRLWTMWSLILTIAFLVVGIGLAIMIPALLNMQEQMPVITPTSNLHI